LKLKIPYLTYPDVGKKAEGFLNEYHPSFEIPIPIEDIVELKLRINIFPFPRLYKDHGLNGFLSRDLRTINVDEYQFDQLNEKYRFTLAHEVGHYVLHRSFYENLPKFESTDEYVEWRMSFPPEEMNWFEKQGDWFAEQVLVPTKPLFEVCQEVVQKYKKIFAEFDQIPEDIWSYISTEVATYFEVNPPVIEIRIRRENITDKIPLT